MPGADKYREIKSNAVEVLLIGIGFCVLISLGQRSESATDVP